jgi:hypothetical protein
MQKKQPISRHPMYYRVLHCRVDFDCRTDPYVQCLPWAGVLPRSHAPTSWSWRAVGVWGTLLPSTHPLQYPLGNQVSSILLRPDDLNHRMADAV